MKNKERKLDQLFRTSREAPGVPAPEDFVELVMSGIDTSTADKVIAIDLLLPKLAWAAAFVVTAFLTSEIIMNATGLPDLAGGTAEIANAFDVQISPHILP